MRFCPGAKCRQRARRAAKLAKDRAMEQENEQLKSDKQDLVDLIQGPELPPPTAHEKDGQLAAYLVRGQQRPTH